MDNNYKHTRPLTERELQEIAQNIILDDIPIDNKLETDIKDDEDEDELEEPVDFWQKKIGNKANLSEGIGSDRFEFVFEDDDVDVPNTEDMNNPTDDRGAPVDNLSRNKESNDKPSSSMYSARTETNKEEPDRKWRKRELQITIPDYSFSEGAVENEFVTCETPTDNLLKLLEPIIKNILFQSNLYAVQREKILNMKQEEFITFIGVNIFMGYHRLPNWSHYWVTAADLGVPLVSSAMSRDRLDAILSNLHVNDNSKIQKIIRINYTSFLQW